MHIKLTMSLFLFLEPLQVVKQIRTQKFRYATDGRSGLRNQDKEFMNLKVREPGIQTVHKVQYAMTGCIQECICTALVLGNTDENGFRLRAHPNSPVIFSWKNYFT